MIFRRSKTTTNGSHDSPESGPSIIAADVTIEGNITATGQLHIDGTVFGSIRARSCVIDMNGFVQGEITAEEVFIRGRVIGPIRGLHVNLYAGAQVEGDIVNETISIENGANVYGMISRAEDPTGESSAPTSGIADSKAYPAASLAIAQDNYFENVTDDAYRPIKVIRP